MAMRPIPGFPDYAACDEGHVWRVTRPHSTRWVNISLPYKMKAKLSPKRKYPYLSLTLMNPDGEPISRRVNRLVATAWHGPPPFANAEAAHIDGDRVNNRPSNLRWSTPVENYADKR